MFGFFRPKPDELYIDRGSVNCPVRGTDVEVPVSKGPERYAVPNVVNKSKAEASEQITATLRPTPTTGSSSPGPASSGV